MSDQTPKDNTNQTDDDFFRELDELNQIGSTSDDIFEIDNDIASTSTQPDPLAQDDPVGDEVFFDIDDLGNMDNNQPTNPTQTHDIGVDDITKGIDEQDALDLPILDTTPPNPQNDKLAQSLDNITQNTQNTTNTDQTVTAIPPKKGLFGSKKPATKQSAKISKTPKSDLTKIAGDKKNLNLIILGAITALLLLVAAWFLANSDTPTQTPATPEPVATAPATEPDQTAITEPVADTPEPTADTNISTDTPQIDTAPKVNAEAIVNAQIPEDPALIKEEIDRLKDKDAQLSEQAKLIDEQLSTLEELTSAKEEQIKLLEAQIEQLESQKGN